MPLLLLKRGGTCEGDDVRVMTPLLAQPDLLLSVHRLYLVFSFFSLSALIFKSCRSALLGGCGF
jgi:hypothetical protein